MTTYHLIKAVLPWVMSIVTIASMLLAGEKKRSAWIIGLLNQCLWSLFIVMTGNWGLAPLTVAMTIVYVRNLWKWSRYSWYKIDKKNPPSIGDTITVGNIRAIFEEIKPVYSHGFMGMERPKVKEEGEKECMFHGVKHCCERDIVA